ncbi:MULTISPECIES: CoA transferase [unclassified Duganella]|uniref:CoA transferase n=1 Tax=unclassified Duganella TaxID=2636909 RepID=UPI0018F6CBED|nr:MULTISPECIES: CoA transferase [unclassified Duganella]
MLEAISSALSLSARECVRFTGEGELPSCYAVTELAAASVGAAALAVRQLIVAQGGRPAEVVVDRRLASLWFSWTLRPVGWELPPLWDPVAGDYRTADGWIRLHTNAPHHRDAALAVLKAPVERAAVARAVAGWRGAELEAAVVAQGGCAAMMRSSAEWAVHEQGRAVAGEPLIALSAQAGSFNAGWTPTPSRPLAGLKVLDLTRVLAGPVATRFLAGYGAEVLRIDPPGWNEPGVIPEVTLGKRCARLDLRREPDRAVFEQLLAEADVLVHGYRSDALEGLGYGEQMRRQLNPGLVDVALDAYGWSGPLSGRRGFDSLVQMSAGIAHRGMQWRGADKPVPLPVQALDHATGYLIAAAVVRGLLNRLAEGSATRARLSLARTALLLTELSPLEASGAQPLAAASDADLVPALEQTAWGEARRYRPPVAIDGAPMAWTRPASELGSSAPSW